LRITFQPGAVVDVQGYTAACSLFCFMSAFFQSNSIASNGEKATQRGILIA